MDIDAAAQLFIVLKYAFVAGVLGLPAVALTLRLGLKPLVDAIIRLREAFPRASAGELHALERQVLELRDELRELRAAHAFDAELLGRSGTEHGHAEP